VVGPGATVTGSIVGRDCWLGANTVVEAGAVLGDRTTLTDFTRV
jgi:acetyltransferase-like isoleucine patch superfamily enzyme